MEMGIKAHKCDCEYCECDMEVEFENATCIGCTMEREEIEDPPDDERIYTRRAWA